MAPIAVKPDMHCNHRHVHSALSYTFTPPHTTLNLHCLTKLLSVMLPYDVNSVWIHVWLKNDWTMIGMQQANSAWCWFPTNVVNNYCFTSVMVKKKKKKSISALSTVPHEFLSISKCISHFFKLCMILKLCPVINNCADHNCSSCLE